VSLGRASELVARGEGRYEANVPDGWQQGRGAFGGLVMALLCRAARAEEADAARRLRVVNAEIVGPVGVGAAEVVASVVRRSSAVTTMEARLHQGGEIAARATFVYGRDRAPDGDGRWLEPPRVEAWDALPALPSGPPAPVFTQHFQLRSRGPFPFTASTETEARGWVRPRELPAGWQDHDVLALCDAWWPIALCRFGEIRPMATVGFALELLVDPATLPPGGAFVYRATMPAGQGGYVLDLRELWTADGTLVALNQQTFCLIK
jgi:Thioesterase-like superfamily